MPPTKQSVQDAQKALIILASLCLYTCSHHPRVATAFTHCPLVHPPAHMRSIARFECLPLIHAAMPKVPHNMGTFSETSPIVRPVGSHARRTMHHGCPNVVMFMCSLHPGPPFRLCTYLPRPIPPLIPGAHFGATLAHMHDPRSCCSLPILPYISSALILLSFLLSLVLGSGSGALLENTKVQVVAACKSDLLHILSQSFTCLHPICLPSGTGACKLTMNTPGCAGSFSLAPH